MNYCAPHGLKIAFNRRTWAAAIVMASLMLSARIDLVSADEPAATKSDVQFGGECTEGLAEGQHVMTKCTTRWTDKDGKTYCFSGESAKKSFLQNPAENLQRARAFMAASNVESTETAMQNYTGSDAQAVAQELIDAKLKANKGVFPFDDPLNGDHLKLAFDDVDFTSPS
jgi:YHS domain-containing protein